MWNMNLPGAPPVDFHKFFDGENITQDDLVAWVNVGMHHLASSLLHEILRNDSYLIFRSLNRKMHLTHEPTQRHQGWVRGLLYEEKN